MQTLPETSGAKTNDQDFVVSKICIRKCETFISRSWPEWDWNSRPCAYCAHALPTNLSGRQWDMIGKVMVHKIKRPRSLQVIIRSIEVCQFKPHLQLTFHIFYTIYIHIYKVKFTVFRACILAANFPYFLYSRHTYVYEVKFMSFNLQNMYIYL